MTMQKFPGTEVQQRVTITPKEEDQRFCQCGHGVFNMGFMLYEIKTGVIGQKGLAPLQIFTCQKCGLPAQEDTIRSKPKPLVEEKSL